MSFRLSLSRLHPPPGAPLKSKGNSPCSAHWVACSQDMCPVKGPAVAWTQQALGAPGRESQVLTAWAEGQTAPGWGPEDAERCCRPGEPQLSARPPQPPESCERGPHISHVLPGLGAQRCLRSLQSGGRDHCPAPRSPPASLWELPTGQTSSTHCVYKVYSFF